MDSAGGLLFSRWIWPSFYPLPTTLDVVGDARIAGGLTSGNVGIGTAPSTPRLHVRGGSAHLGFYTDYNGEGFLSLAGPGAAISLTRTNLGSWPASPAAGDAYQIQNNAGTLRVWTSGNGDLLTLTSGGKLGVGTSPGARLHVRGGAVHLGPYTEYDVEGYLSLAGHSAALSLARRDITTWPTAPAAGDAYHLYNHLGTLRVWTWGAGDLLGLTKDGKLDVRTGLQVNGTPAVDSSGTAMRTYYAP